MRRINPHNVLSLLSEKFAAHTPTPVSAGDRLLADGIEQLIEQCMEAPSFDIEMEEILEISGRPKDIDDTDNSKEHVRDQLTEDQLEQALQYYRSTSSHTRPLSSMMNRHKYIKGEHHMQQILR
jgi:hypothetical protein